MAIKLIDMDSSQISGPAIANMSEDEPNIKLNYTINVRLYICFRFLYQILIFKKVHNEWTGGACINQLKFFCEFILMVNPETKTPTASQILPLWFFLIQNFVVFVLQSSVAYCSGYKKQLVFFLHVPHYFVCRPRRSPRDAKLSAYFCKINTFGIMVIFSFFPIIIPARGNKLL